MSIMVADGACVLNVILGWAALVGCHTLGGACGMCVIIRGAYNGDAALAGVGAWGDLLAALISICLLITFLRHFQDIFNGIM